MTLTMGEIGDLITALDAAIEYRMSIMTAELPSSSKWHDERDKVNAECWRH
jgi:hypothetical protein